jgi:hypothetical protein
LVASTFVALLSGSGIVAAQRVDDPPGSGFQTRSFRAQNEGVRGTPSVFSRTARAARRVQADTAVPHHKVVRRHRYPNS